MPNWWENDPLVSEPGVATATQDPNAPMQDDSWWKNDPLVNQPARDEHFPIPAYGQQGSISTEQPVKLDHSQWLNQFFGISPEATMPEKFTQDAQQKPINQAAIDDINNRYQASLQMTEDPLKQQRIRENRDADLESLGVGLIKPPDLMADVNRPLLELPQLSNQEAETLFGKGNVGQVIAGVQRGGTGLLQFFTSPLGVATLGTASLPVGTQRAISGMFAVDMARHLPEQAQELADALGSGDVAKATELTIGAAGGLYFSKKAFEHAIGKQPLTPSQKLSELIGKELLSQIKQSDFKSQLDVPEQQNLSPGRYRGQNLPQDMLASEGRMRVGEIPQPPVVPIPTEPPSVARANRIRIQAPEPSQPAPPVEVSPPIVPTPATPVPEVKSPIVEAPKTDDHLFRYDGYGMGDQNYSVTEPIPATDTHPKLSVGSYQAANLKKLGFKLEDKPIPVEPVEPPAAPPVAAQVPIVPKPEPVKPAVVEPVAPVVPVPVEPTLPPSISKAKKVPAKEQKKYLLSETDKLIKEAPDTQDFNNDAGRDVAKLEQSLLDNKGAHSAAIEANVDFLKKYGVDPNKPGSSKTPVGPAKAATDLYQELHSAIELEKYRQLPHVQIDVPDDGSFSVINSKEALKKFKDNAKRFPGSDSIAKTETTKVATKPSAIPSVAKNVPALEAAKLVELVSSTDATRPTIAKTVYSNGHELVATDGRRLLRVLAKGPGTIKEPVLIRDGKEMPDNELNRFPNFTQVIPKLSERRLIAGGLDTGELIRAVRQALLAGKESFTKKNSKPKENESVWIYKNPDGSVGIESKGLENDTSYRHNIHPASELVTILNGNFLEEGLTIARKLGIEKVDLHSTDQGDTMSPVMLTGKGMEYVVMPIRGDAGIQSHSKGIGSNANPSHEAIPEPIAPPKLKPESKTKKQRFMSNSDLIQSQELMSQSLPVASGSGLEGIKSLVERSNLSQKVKDVIQALLVNPVFEKFDWSDLTLELHNNLGTGSPGDRLANFIRLVENATPATLPHEIFHVLFDMLPKADKATLESLRQQALKEAFGDSEVIQSMRDGTMISDEFIAAKLPTKFYHLINPSEFLAVFAGEKFVRDHAIENAGPLGQLWNRVRDWLGGIVDSIKRAFGVDSPIKDADLERIYRKALAGDELTTPETGKASEIQRSYQSDEESSKAAKIFATTPELKRSEAMQTSVQSIDLANILTKVGVGDPNLSHAIRSSLDYFKYIGQSTIAQDLNGGQRIGYDAWKAHLKQTLPPEQAEYQIKWNARLLASKLADFNANLEKVKAVGAKAAVDINAARFVALEGRKVQAELEKVATTNLEMTSRVMLDAALKKAERELQVKNLNDHQVAEIDGRINEIHTAMKSSSAMQQLMHDMFATLNLRPDGVQALTDPNFGTRTDILDIYKDIKTSIQSPLHNENLLNWAAHIIQRNKKLLDQWQSAFLAPKVSKQVLNAYEQQFLADMEADPVKTLQRELRERGKMATKKERARKVFLDANEAYLDKYRELTDKMDAASYASKVQADPDYQKLRVDVRDDVGKIGDIEPWQPFDPKSSLILPSGLPLTVNPKLLMGSKTAWNQLYPKLDAGVKELQAWLLDPQNAESQNFGTHEMDLKNLQTYFTNLSMHRPNDPIYAWRFSMYMMDNALGQAGGRIAQAGKRALSMWDRVKIRSGQWGQTWSNQIEHSRRAAIISHGITWKERTREDLSKANEDWWKLVGRELAASWDREEGGLKAGDQLASGAIVTREDMADLRVQADATSAGYKVAESEGLNWGPDMLGDTVFYRKLQKVSDNMTRKQFNKDLLPLAEAIHEARALYFEAVKAKDTAAMNLHRDKLADLLNGAWSEIGPYLIAERRNDFAKPTTFDGDNGALLVLKPDAHTIDTFDELVNRLEQLTGLPHEDVRNEILQEFVRIIDGWHEAASNDDLPVGSRIAPTETKNNFSRTRGTMAAPSVFYDYGFRNTSASIGSFGNAIHKRALDVVTAAFNATIKDIDRQMDEFRTASSKVGEKVALSENARMRAAGETYDNFKRLEKRKAMLTDVLEALQINEKRDASGDITIGRTIGSTMGFLISGVLSTFRNIFASYPMLGNIGHAMTGSWIQSYPRAAMEVYFVQELKALATFVTSGLKGLYYVPVDFVTALGSLKHPDASLGMFLDKTFRRWFIEMGETMYERFKDMRLLKEAGIVFPHPAAQEFENVVLGSYLTAGKILPKSMSGSEKFWQTPAAMMEFPLRFLRTYAPFIGDAAINVAAGNYAKGYVVPALARMLDRIYEESMRTGYRTWDFNNLSNPKNIISPEELMPSGFMHNAHDQYTRMRVHFDKSGTDFNEAAMRYLKAVNDWKTAGGPKPQFLNSKEIQNLQEVLINFINRPSPGNSPLNLKQRGFLTALVSPFMPYKFRMLADVLNNFSIAGNIDRMLSSAQLKQFRYKQWAMMLGGVLLPFLLNGAISGVIGTQQARIIKKVLFNQITADRQPWENNTTAGQAKGWIIQAVSAIPFVDMAINAALNDMPNRASLDPSLAMVEKAKDVARYFGGIVQTHDITYRLPELIMGLVPDSKIILNRLGTGEGKRDLANDVALLRRHGDVDMLRPMGQGNSIGVNATPLTPYGAILANAIMSGDQTKVQQAFDEAVNKAKELGIANPEQRVRQMAMAKSPYNSAFNTKLTQEQHDALLARMPASDRASVEDAEAKFTQAAQTIGGHITFTKVTSGTGVSGGSVGGGATLSAPAVSRAYRAKSLPISASIGALGRRAKKPKGSGRIGLGGRRSRIGLKKLKIGLRRGKRV